MTRSDAETRKLLTPEQFEITRKQDADRRRTSALVHEKRSGVFSCVGCDSPLFEAA